MTFGEMTFRDKRGQKTLELLLVSPVVSGRDAHAWMEQQREFFLFAHTFPRFYRPEFGILTPASIRRQQLCLRHLVCVCACVRVPDPLWRP